MVKRHFRRRNNSVEDPAQNVDNKNQDKQQRAQDHAERIKPFRPHKPDMKPIEIYQKRQSYSAAGERFDLFDLKSAPLHYHRDAVRRVTKKIPSVVNREKERDSD